MNLREVLELIQLRRFERDPVTRLLNRTHMPDDFRAVAKRKLPRAVFDYVEGGADEEIAIDANRQAFVRRKLNPQLLRDVSVIDLTGEFLGHQFSVPLGLAPTGYTRMMHPTGEVSACSAAKAKGIPYTLSTMGTTTIEEVAATGHPNLWFQLYVTSDRRLSDPLIDRAAAAGYQALVLTIDTVVTGRRTRDLRGPGLSAGSVDEIALFRDRRCHSITLDDDDCACASGSNQSTEIGLHGAQRVAIDQLDGSRNDAARDQPADRCDGMRGTRKCRGQRRSHRGFRNES